MNVFISHSETDRVLAENLSRHLKSYGYEISNPMIEAEPGANWRLEVGRALEEADAMVVLLTPAFANSPSVRSDIDYALSNPRFQNRLVPVLGRPTQSIPWILGKLSPRVIRASSDLSQTAGEIAAALGRKKTTAGAK